jgi:diamine N-acetyltransferase
MVVPSDESAIYAWENNTENWLISDTRRPFTKEAIHHFVHGVHDLQLNQQLRMMIVELKTNRILGAIDLFDYDYYHKRAGIGILIANAADRGRGFGKESLRLTIRYAFEHIGLKQLYCNILTSNASSIRLFESNGFTLVGIKKSWIRAENGFLDEALYQLVH